MNFQLKEKNWLKSVNKQENLALWFRELIEVNYDIGFGDPYFIWNFQLKAIRSFRTKSMFFVSHMSVPETDINLFLIKT